MKKKKYILGIDEAGRGCLAGPVYVAAVLFNDLYSNSLIIDSKKLSPKDRELAYSIIKKDAIWYNFYSLSNPVIDNIGIAKAVYLLMNYLYNDVKQLFPDLDIFTIIDGIVDPVKQKDSCCIVKADQKITAVSAASIVAKVERDKYMKQISKFFPQYSFYKHKGYGTKSHINEIMNSGLSIIHRKSFSLSSKAIKYSKS